MKKSGDKQTQTNTDKHTTPTRGRIIVADGIYSVGDKKVVMDQPTDQLTDGRTESPLIGTLGRP